MPLYSRVFAPTDAVPSPEALAEHLAGLGLATTVFGEGPVWWRLEVTFADGSPLTLERFTADEPGIRAELNSWAAHLEALDSPAAEALMERVIQARQLITLHKPTDGAEQELACVALCQLLAWPDGLIQVDGHGFFGPDLALLVAEA
jgi:hypothetical protein